MLASVQGPLEKWTKHFTNLFFNYNLGRTLGASFGWFFGTITFYDFHNFTNYLGYSLSWNRQNRVFCSYLKTSLISLTYTIKRAYDWKNRNFQCGNPFKCVRKMIALEKYLSRPFIKDLTSFHFWKQIHICVKQTRKVK